MTKLLVPQHSPELQSCIFARDSLMNVLRSLISKILKPIAFISPILRVTLQLLLKTLLIQLLQPWPEQNIIVIITTSDSPIY